MKVKYKAKTNGFLSDKDAMVIGPEIERIQKTYGIAKPSAVVGEARKKTSPLHQYFTWDDALAGEKYREWEARNLMRDVVIVNRNQEEFRAFLNIRAVENESRFEGRGYMGAEDVFSNEDYKQQVLKRAYSEIKIWQHRYKSLKEFSEVHEAIGRVAV